MTNPLMTSNTELEVFKEKHLKQVLDNIKRSKSDNSLRAYANAWKRFKIWCKDSNYAILDSPEVLVPMFLSDMQSRKSLKYASINAYLSGIRYFYANEHNHTLKKDSMEFRAMMSGIRRDLGVRPTQKKALIQEDLWMLVDSLGDDLRAKRDKALLLVWFYGAFRRGELTSLKLENIDFRIQGMSVFVEKSKTDQDKMGRNVGIFYNNPKPQYCPVRALRAWIAAGEIETGSLFRKIRKGGSVSSHGLAASSVAVILKDRLRPFGMDKDISGHSMRAGHVTSAIKKKISAADIMKQTGHNKLDTMMKYVRFNNEFENNSSQQLMS